MTRAEAPSEPVPDLIHASISGMSLAAASANIVMQLSRLPVGHGVAHSKVESGRVDRHPAKRTRTTLSYIAVAMLGTDAERVAMRREVNRQHRQVRSAEPVPYNAFDRDLQLWVAACLYYGYEQIVTMIYGPPSPEALATLYRHGARFGTTLQVTEDQWPADRAAFQEYWDASLDRIETDETTRRFLLDLAALKFLPAPVRVPLAPLNQLLTAGFLPPRFRDELGLPWTAADQRRFDRFTGIAARLHRVLPSAARQFPFNVYLWDTRRRIRSGRPIV